MGKDTAIYDSVMDAIVRDKIVLLPGFVETVPGFPVGQDDFIHRYWIRNAIDSGSPATVRWMLEHGAPVNYKDAEGYTSLIAAIYRDGDDRYDVMKTLIEFGADVNAQGTNDWTPAHLAVRRNDVRALRILHEACADFTVRTRIDTYETPLEEGLRWGDVPEAVAYLESLGLP